MFKLDSLENEVLNEKKKKIVFFLSLYTYFIIEKNYPLSSLWNAKNWTFYEYLYLFEILYSL